MGVFDRVDPDQFIIDFNRRFHDAVTTTDEDLASIVDRFHTADVVQVSDGNRMDRDKLIAHLRPIRRQKPVSRVEVDDALAAGDCLAARYRMYVDRPKADGTIDSLLITIHTFNRYAADRRLRRADILTTMERLEAEATTTEAGAVS